jgi:hypothetical protein
MFVSTRTKKVIGTSLCFCNDHGLEPRQVPRFIVLRCPDDPIETQLVQISIQHGTGIGQVVLLDLAECVNFPDHVSGHVFVVEVHIDPSDDQVVVVFCPVVILMITLQGQINKNTIYNNLLLQ